MVICTRLITAYEDRLRSLETQKLELSEKCEKNGAPQATFEEMFERAKLFLANPQKIWENGDFEEKRTVLKLAFSDNLAYQRNQGFRTPKTSIPFKVLDGFSNVKSNMVRPAGLEPAASRLEVSRSIQMSYGRFILI